MLICSDTIYSNLRSNITCIFKLQHFNFKYTNKVFCWKLQMQYLLVTHITTRGRHVTRKPYTLKSKSRDICNANHIPSSVWELVIYLKNSWTGAILLYGRRTWKKKRKYINGLTDWFNRCFISYKNIVFVWNITWSLNQTFILQFAFKEWGV